MKKYSFYLLAFLCLSFAACSDDDSCSGKTEAISVVVEGVTMTNITGTAFLNEESISINIAGDSANDASVFFSCPRSVDTYDLNFDLTGNTGSRTITAFVPAETLNVILSTGCFDVVSIDDSEVVMRFNVNEDETNINGEIALTVR